MDEEGRRILSASGHICIEVIMVVGYGGLGMVEDMVLDELRLSELRRVVHSLSAIWTDFFELRCETSYVEATPGGRIGKGRAACTKGPVEIWP